MYRKSSRFKITPVLCVLIVAAILLSGCVASMPVPTPFPTATARPPCDPPAPVDPPWIAKDAAVRYIGSRYPEQTVPLADSSDPARDTPGDWTINVECPGSPCHVIVTNEVTGFRWEGYVYWSGGSMDYTLCSYTPEKVEKVSECAVVLTAPTPNR
jgi:hypothetical protein